MPVSGQTIRDALSVVGAVGKQIRSFDELAAGADDALRQAPRGLTASGAASFLATTAQESAYYRTTVEYGSGQRYAPYIGRGFVQCTWAENYRAFGRWCQGRGLVSDPEVFVRTPTALGDYRWAWLTAVWYYESTRLWDWANAGDHMKVSQAVNGGRGRAGTSFVPNHITQRLAMFDAFRRAGNALLPSGSAPAAPASPKGLPEMIERPLVTGLNEGRIVCPTGSASGIVAQSWASVSLTGGGRVQMWFQKGARSDAAAPGAGQPVDWTIWNAERPWVEVPSGTEFLEYRITSDGPGSLLIEQKAR